MKHSLLSKDSILLMAISRSRLLPVKTKSQKQRLEKIQVGLISSLDESYARSIAKKLLGQRTRLNKEQKKAVEYFNSDIDKCQ